MWIIIILLRISKPLAFHNANIVAIRKDLTHTDGCTVIIVTHDPVVAEEADTVLQMKDGSLKWTPPYPRPLKMGNASFKKFSEIWK